MDAVITIDEKYRFGYIKAKCIPFLEIIKRF